MRYLVLVAALCGLALNPNQAWCAEDAPQTGLFDISFTKRSPHGTLRSLYRRFREKSSRDRRDYDISNQRYQIYVPEDYDSKKSYGLMVWLQPSRAGELSQGHQVVFGQNRMIWIRPLPRGGGGMWYQMGLAIDAVYNVDRQYQIDKKRIYIAGVGSSSKPAARLGFGAADVFPGGAYLMGPIEFYDDVTVEVSGDTMYYWPADYGMPPRKSLRIAKQQSRFVFQVDAADGRTRDLIEHALRPRRFKNLFELSSGHRSATPDAGTLARAIQMLDLSGSSSTP